MASQAPIQASEATVSVKGEDLTHVLERAVDSRAKIRIKARGLGCSGRCDGIIIRVESNRLIVSVAEIAKADLISPAYCDGTLSMPEGIYVFSFAVDTEATHDSGRQIAINRPDTLQLIQRRRFVRARLSPSTVVSIDIDSETIEGVLLNLSEEGLACKVDSRVADVVSVDDSAILRFVSPGDEEVFNLPSTVSRKTRGATDEGVVIAFVFRDARSSLSARERIRQIIGNHQSIVPGEL